MTAIEMFQIGGCVRDHLMGKKSKDIDFVVIAPSFEVMEEAVRARCTKVFEDKDGKPVGAEFHTLRGLDPVLGAVDFVWARIDGPSSDGRHPDWVKPGSLDDDQRRRDFTVNSIAMLDDGTLIDPFGGQADIEAGILRFVGTAADRLREDALRAFRGVRFQITKGFRLTDDAREFIASMPAESFDAVSTERVREELHKCFATDTMETLRVLTVEFPNLLSLALDRGLWFKPTTEAH
jgi:tRNA nucleotidyltransferase (CCA-adding enzyme)